MPIRCVKGIVGSLLHTGWVAVRLVIEQMQKRKPVPGIGRRFQSSQMTAYTQAETHNFA